MKKIIYVSIGSVIFLVMSSIVAYFLRYMNYETALAPLVIGLIILIISGIFAYGIKDADYKLNIIPFILSSVSLGFLIKSWYIYRNFDNTLLTMIIVSLLCIVYLWFFYGLAQIPFIEKHIEISLILYIILSLIIYILVVIFTKTTYVSTFGYYMIIEIAFIFALCNPVKNTTELIRNLTISTYSVVIVAIIIIIIMLSGEGIDCDLSGLDFSISSPNDKKKKI